MRRARAGHRSSGLAPTLSSRSPRTAEGDAAFARGRRMCWRGGRCTASIRRSASSRSRAIVDVSDANNVGRDWRAAAALGQLAAEPRAGRGQPGHAGAGPAARAGADPVRAPDQHVPGRPSPAGREPGGDRGGSRAARRRLGRARPGHGRHGQGPGRTIGPHGGPPRPTGAGRHRLHHRAPLPPVFPADRRARPAARRRERPDARRRCRRPGGTPASLAARRLPL